MSKTMGRTRRCASLAVCAGYVGVAASLFIASPAAAAESDSTFSGLNIGMNLDGFYTDEELALGRRSRGLGLGHTEISANANIDDWFRGQVTIALDSHDGELELELEEAFLDTTALPAGLSVRAGRFLSQIGYLNNRHLHTDDFGERPLLYRAFLGNHFFDDGLRLNYLLPTSVFWQFGVEAFTGRSLVGESVNDPSLGALTVSTKIGGDIGKSQSWQLGLGLLRNKLEPEEHEEEEDEAAGEEHEHEEEHGHDAEYVGKNMAIADFTWKWSPGGNNRSRQLRLSAEYARVTNLFESASPNDRHEAWYLSGVYRFTPKWEAGIRFGDLKVAAHEADEESGRLRETSLMLAFKRSEFSTLRLEYTRQDNKGEFDDATNRIMLQYVVSLGAHGAHSF